MNCLLDLDGCLADFVTGALELMEEEGLIDLSEYGYSDKFYYKPDLDKVYAGNFGKFNLNELLGIPANKFFEKMGYKFWNYLPRMPDFFEILDQIESKFNRDNVYICTAPIDTPGCLEGKREWIKRNLHASYKSRTIITSAKHMMDKAAVLIDDADKNCAKFPGRSILLPRIWNSRYADRNRTLEVLEDELSGI